MKKYKNKKGFVLIELAIAVLIIGILASVASLSVIKSQRISRDTQRKSDISLIEKTLESYYAQNKIYPPSYSSSVVSQENSGVDPNIIQGIDAWDVDLTASTSTNPVWIDGSSDGSQAIPGLAGFTDKLPNDPKGNGGSAGVLPPIFSGQERNHYYGYYSRSCSDVVVNPDNQCPYKGESGSYKASTYYILAAVLENTSDSEAVGNSDIYYLNCAKMKGSNTYNQNAYVKLSVVK